jgi:hypothetical protein
MKEDIQKSEKLKSEKDEYGCWDVNDPMDNKCSFSLLSETLWELVCCSKFISLRVKVASVVEKKLFSILWIFTTVYSRKARK